MRLAASICLAALLFASTPSFSQPSPGSLLLRGSIGYASQELNDWNDDIENSEQALQSAGVPVSWDTFGGAVPFGFELGYQASQLVSVSVLVFRQSDSADNSYSDFSGSLAINTEVAITSLTGSVSYWAPGTRGLFFGVNAGIGWGTAKSELIFRDFFDATNNVDINGDWSGSGFVGGGFGGYQHEFPGGFSVHAKLGYQFQNLGEFDGDVTSPQLGSRSGPPVDNSGRPMDTNLSGVQLTVGMGIVFGTR